MSFVFPFALVGLPVLAGLFLLHSRIAGSIAGLPAAWRRAIEPEIGRYLGTGGKAVINSAVLCCLAAGLLLIGALARPMIGVAQPQNFANFAGRVVVLDLGVDTDLAEMRHFTSRLMETAPDLPTALVVTRGEAYTIVPFTVDQKQVSRYLGVVAPEIIPADGRALHGSIAHAEALIARAGIPFGQIVVVSTDPPPAKVIEIASSTTHRVMAAKADGPAWRRYADNYGAETRGFDDAARISTDFLNLANGAAAAHQVQGRFELTPILIGLSLLFWAHLFRRRAAS